MATAACDAQPTGMGALPQPKLPFPQARDQVVLPAHSCAPSVWAAEMVI